MRSGDFIQAACRAIVPIWSMIPKSGDRFSEKIMLDDKLERDDRSHPAPAR
jgi:hypothetical protein